MRHNIDNNGGLHYAQKTSAHRSQDRRLASASQLEPLPRASDGQAVCRARFLRCPRLAAGEIRDGASSGGGRVGGHFGRGDVWCFATVFLSRPSGVAAARASGTLAEEAGAPQRTQAERGGRRLLGEGQSRGRLLGLAPTRRSSAEAFQYQGPPSQHRASLGATQKKTPPNGKGKGSGESGPTAGLPAVHE